MSSNFKCQDSNNRLGRGPAHLAEPFTHITNEFWPDRAELREEAEAIRENEQNRFRIKIPTQKEQEPVTLDFQFLNENTPVLAEFYKNFQEWFGETGHTYVHYFYIDKDADYEYHRDNIIHEIEIDTKEVLDAVDTNRENEAAKLSNFPVNCCINLVVSDDGSECEFQNHGLYKYTAGILNTSHLHRVFPTSQRILARISFLELIYEEVVHRVRKLEKRNKK